MFHARRSHYASPLLLTISKQDSSQDAATGTTIQPSYTIQYAPTFKHRHVAARVADFDNRLAFLEAILGAPPSFISKLEKHSEARPMLPTLDEIARQVSVLTDASAPHLDNLHRRVKALTEQAERLTEARKAANAAVAGIDSSAGGGVKRRGTGNANPLSPDLGADEGGFGGMDSERDAKINALYSTLPTIEKLSPIIPAVLDRLRSLRAIHADAGKAAAGLDEIEKKQAEMAGDIKNWSAALERVEQVMERTAVVFMNNVEKVEEWVRELEARVQALDAMGDDEP